MPLEGHWQRQHATRATDSTRERRVMAALAAALLACALAVAVVAATSGSGRAARGCVSIGVASTTGGAMMHVCGTKARRLCRGETAAARDVARELPRACRRAGLG